ncbi:MAG TPA: hypothetical protein VGR62_01640 [Candidatus Binatia bacterium]|nr:hypothetical protein [Candidatus Binatia bacterium]
MTRVVLLLALVLALGGVRSADAFCGCRHVKAPRCTPADAKHRVTVRVDLAVVDGTVEVLTQTGPYRMPVADLDGKQVVFLFLPKGEVLQGFFEEVVPGGLAIGTMQGAQFTLTTGAIFTPGEYELVLFVDAVPGGGVGPGPQRGDIAAFDNTICEPTGVSVRFAVGCEDTTVTLTNKHFILF